MKKENEKLYWVLDDCKRNLENFDDLRLCDIELLLEKSLERRRDKNDLKIQNERNAMEKIKEMLKNFY